MNRKRRSSPIDNCFDSDSRSPWIKVIKKQRIMAFSGETPKSKLKENDPDSAISTRTRRRKKAIIESDSEESIVTVELPKRRGIHRPEIADDDLTIETKEAMRLQKERDERIRLQQEREETARLERLKKQIEYNGTILVEHEQKQLPVAFELVLETDTRTGDIVVEVDLMLVQHMKKHQVEGVRFLWNQVFESTERIRMNIDPVTEEDKGGSGAILAHCMGLGKTFTTITLIHTLFRYPKLTHIRRVLILCPLNTATNWRNEFQQWTGKLDPKIPLYLFNAEDIKKTDRVLFLRRWFENGGIMIMGYEMYRLLNYISDPTIKKSKKKEVPKYPHHSDSSSSSSDESSRRKPKDYDLIQTYRKFLQSPGPDLIVCDEGHIIKNPQSAIAQMVNKVRTLRRIILTGTPMQNNLKEYYAMINFCKPNYLGSEHEFSRNFRIPIEAGQHKDSLPREVDYMRRRAFALNQRLKTVLHRRDFDVLRSFLPPKFEYAVKIRCLPVQKELYQTYLLIQNIDPSARLNMAKLLGDYQYLMKIWTHPWLLKPHFIDSYQKYLKGEDRVKSDHFFKEDDSDEEENEKRPTKVLKVTTHPLNKATIHPEKMDVVLRAMKKEWWYDIFDVDQAEYDIELSGKFELFRTIIQECESIGDKVLVFSRSLLSLDYIEHWLAYWNSRTSSKWIKDLDYFRMDGKTSMKQRADNVNTFNNERNSRARLFLISTTAGGVGINLFGANRVIIFDVSWNPAHDLQAMFRAYRLGQKKPVYVYRIIGKGTMEEKVYKRQITKQAMSQRVIDDKQLDRHFTNDELSRLYRFEPDEDDDPLDKYDADCVKDKILRNLMDQFSELIVSYREHDSLLIHRDEFSLTEAEKRQANEEETITRQKIYGQPIRQKQADSDDEPVIPIIPPEVIELLDSD